MLQAHHAPDILREKLGAFGIDQVPAAVHEVDQHVAQLFAADAAVTLEFDIAEGPGFGKARAQPGFAFDQRFPRLATGARNKSKITDTARNMKSVTLSLGE